MIVTIEYIRKEKYGLSILLILMMGLWLLTGCSAFKIIERNSSPLISEGMTAKTSELHHELDQFSEQEELFDMTPAEGMLFDEIKALIIEQAKDHIHITINTDDVDLKLFASEQGKKYLYVAVFSDQTKVPHTTIGLVDLKSDGTFKLKHSFIGDFLVNMPKTVLRTHGHEIAIVSQRPFSTFEECYVFDESKQLKLTQTYWRDRSLNYYSQIERLMLAGDFEAAMTLEDDTEYPMSYEKQLFHSGQTVFKETLRLKQVADLPPAKGLQYCEWGLDYYFMQHYAMTTKDLIKDTFDTILKEKETDYGAKYTVDAKTLKEGMLLYANFLAKNAKEKEAESLRQLVKEKL